MNKTALVDQIPEYVRQMQPYRPGKPIDEMKAEYGFDRVIKLASNENPFGASPLALKAAQESLSETYRYPDPVSRKLRGRIAESLGITPEELVVGAGSENLLALTIRTMMRPSDEAVGGQGAFMGFDIHLSAHGGKLIKAASPNFRFDVDAILSAITPKTKIVYVPNPNNPTGTYLTEAEIKKLLAGVPGHVLILLDEAYIEFCGHLPDYPDSLKLRQDNLIILRTFSKAHGLAGFRIGYGIGPKSFIEQISKVKMTFEPSMPAQAAALAAWDDHEFLKKTVDNNNSERERFYACFDELGWRYVPSVGNFVLVDLGDADKVLAVNEALLKQGIAIRPLASFGFPECLRISIGLPEENNALFAALKNL